MPFTMVAWSESQTLAALGGVAAVPDPHVTVQGDQVRIPEWAPTMFCAYLGGVAQIQGQFRSPSILSKFSVPYTVEPIDVSAEPISRYPLLDLRSNPLELVPNEGLENWYMGAGGAERSSAFAWLTDGNFPAVQGRAFTARATNATTLVAFTWVNGALTFADVLPAGRYAVIGMRARSATLLGARLVFPGSAYRPGCVGLDAVADIDDPIFRHGTLGSWGEFDQTSPPTVDFFAVTTDSAQTVDLDLIRVA